MNRVHLNLSLALAVLTTVVLFVNNAKASPPLHHSEIFLDSVYSQARLQAPRLGLAALHSHLAQPSLLQKWGIVSADAIASYNDFTNTLILQPEMTVYDSEFGGWRLPSLQEIHQTIGATALPAASVIFHELSHAEYDFYVETGAEDYDRELLQIFSQELPAIVKANTLSFITARPLGSEIFAYYRQALFEMILNDVIEIKLASGLEPDLNTCRKTRTKTDVARNLSPNAKPYSERVQLKTVFVLGTDVTLDLDPGANRRLNDALFRHSFATLKFPANRVELLNVLRVDKKIINAIAVCKIKSTDVMNPR